MKKVICAAAVFCVLCPAQTSPDEVNKLIDKALADIKMLKEANRVYQQIDKDEADWIVAVARRHPKEKLSAVRLQVKEMERLVRLQDKYGKP